MDRELAKEQAALRSGRLRINGYQGCVNYGKQFIDTPVKHPKGVTLQTPTGTLDLGIVCNFDGYYLARYSPEGLCTKCELRQFPDRFHGCSFCRSPLSKDSGPSCLWCSTGFEKWGCNLFKSKGKYYEQGLFRLATYGLNNSFRSCPFITRTDCLSEWPGFYCGNNKWVIPDADKLKDKCDISDITWENSCHVIHRELLKLGIDVTANTQI